MTQTCEYCGDEHAIEEGCGLRLSSGFGRFNKTMKNFCSVECRAWWRRRESDLPGPWEQPAPQGYQGRLDRFVSDDTDDTDADESAAQPATIAGSESAVTVEVEA
jgi:hypothetical protein